MGLLQQGAVDASFIGGAQLDRFGNLNTSYIGSCTAPDTRLPGSGGACDLASLAKRHVIIMAHEKRRFVERVDFITSPGYGSGAGWREDVGLPRGGPAAVITTLGVLRFAMETREMVLTSLHPGVTMDAIHENTGWTLRFDDQLEQTPTPTKRELEMLHRFDPDGYWTGQPAKTLGTSDSE
jgi:glutaconate CoA-transferase subunit B